MLATISIAFGRVQQPRVPAYAQRAVDPYVARRWSSPVFTTAHATFGDAARDYLNIKPQAQQPIDFPHKLHTDDIGVYCDTCHTGVSKGARAGVPSMNVCMSCHEDIGDAGDPRIQALRYHAKRGEDFGCQRVYWVVRAVRLRFNHRMHIRAN